MISGSTRQTGDYWQLWQPASKLQLYRDVNISLPDSIRSRVLLERRLKFRKMYKIKHKCVVNTCGVTDQNQSEDVMVCRITDDERWPTRVERSDSATGANNKVDGDVGDIVSLSDSAQSPSVASDVELRSCAPTTTEALCTSLREESSSTTSERCGSNNLHSPEAYTETRNIRKPTNCNLKVFNANAPRSRKNLQREESLRKNRKAEESSNRYKRRMMIQKKLKDKVKELNRDIEKNLSSVSASDGTERLGSMVGKASGCHLDKRPVPNLRELPMNRIQEMKDAFSLKWLPLTVRFALQSHMTSPSPHRLMRDCSIPNLISSGLLFDKSHVGNAHDDISHQAMIELAEEMKQYDDKSPEISHALLIYEIPIHPYIVYDLVEDRVRGFVHLTEVEQELKKLDVTLNAAVAKSNMSRPPAERVFGEAEIAALMEGNEELEKYGRVQPEVGDKILVFVLVGLKTKVRKIVASYTVKDLSGPFLHHRVWDVICNLVMVGAHVSALVCDDQPHYRSFFKIHSLTSYTTGKQSVCYTRNMYTPDRTISLIFYKQLFL